MTERAQFVRRRPSERFSEVSMLKTVKHLPSVMVWCCITVKGPGQLIQECTGERFVALHALHDLDPNEGPFTFMHDKAPCHTAKSIKTFMGTVSLRVLPWQGNSPDVNAIEVPGQSRCTFVGAKGERILRDCIVSTVLVWGCFSHARTGSLKRIESILRKEGCL